jgi:hypothetical protein
VDNDGEVDACGGAAPTKSLEVLAPRRWMTQQLSGRLATVELDSFSSQGDQP